MSEIVGIKFKNPGKLYYFSPKGVTFKKGDGVIVQTAQGTEFGTVVLPNQEMDDADLKELKPVIRKATEADIARRNENFSKRKQAMSVAQKLANNRKLEMKFVDVDFSFDGTRVVFYFTSEHRIDFRDLVKEIANEFHMRIELRQIGVRDECKIKGGLGPCGRVCCCNDYMCDYGRVSIKMAKHQGLSLNPSKISGLCGRLMCCLYFEDQYYIDTLKFMPKVGSDIDTPKGRAKVDSVDMLRHTVVVKHMTGEESFEFNEYTLDELGITPVYPDCCGSCKVAEEEDSDEDGDVIPTDDED